VDISSALLPANQVTASLEGAGDIVNSGIEDNNHKYIPDYKCNNSRAP